MNQENTPIGVIVGRFQVHALHAAHIELIGTVFKNHKKVLIFLGVSPVTPTRRNPLDFNARLQMMRTFFPKATILPISDTQSDFDWSYELDNRIREAEPFGEVTLYGSRDSFICHYKGRFPTKELETKVVVSGTEVRNQISRELYDSADFRAGWRALNLVKNFACCLYSLAVSICVMEVEQWQPRLSRSRPPSKPRFRLASPSL